MNVNIKRKLPQTVAFFVITIQESVLEPFQALYMNFI